MKSVKIKFRDLFNFLEVGVVGDELEKSRVRLYVPTPDGEITPILGYIRKEKHKIIKVTLEDDTVFRVSDEHLVFEYGKCKKIKHCMKGIDTIDGVKKIIGYDEYSLNSDVYDICLNAPHVYVTPNRVIHHNTSFALQLLESLSLSGYNCGFSSGEESQFQLAFTSRRLGVQNVKISEETTVERICEQMKEFDIMVLDSFQMLDCEDETLTTRKKEKYIIDSLCQAAEETECALIIVMHLTKDGKLKGSTYVPHIVQVNMQILPDKEQKDMRIISVYKNRYGACEDHMAILGSNGYQFQGVHVPENNEEEVVVESKVPLSVRREQMVFSMNEPPHITMGRVMEELNISRQTAYLLLREMVDKNKIEKFGRGDDAIWKITEVSKKTLKDSILSII